MNASRVALALGTSAWESELIRAMAASDAGHQIRRCVDVVELLADCGTGTLDVVVLDPDFPRLDASSVDRLNKSGVRVVGVAATPTAKQQLRRWNVDDTIELGGDVTAAVGQLLLSISRETVIDLRNSNSPAVADDLDAELADSGNLIAVWGPPGAPGTTSIAVALCEHFASREASSILIDLDLWSPGVSDALGMAGEASGLIVACRDAEQTGSTPATLAAAARSITPEFRVLTGISHARRAIEVRATPLRSVLAAARSLCDIIVIDVGSARDPAAFVNDLDGPASAALAEADAIIAVTGCEPVAVARFVSEIQELRNRHPLAALHVVINRTRRSVLPAEQLRELHGLIDATCSPDSITDIPDDRSAFDRAAARGKTLAETAPDSGAFKACRAIAIAITDNLAATNYG